MSSYGDRLDAASAPAWKPEVGDKLIGYIVDIDTYETQFGQDAPVITIQCSDASSTLEGRPIAIGDEFRVFAFAQVLAKEIAKCEPEIGDVVGVKFIGVAEKAKPGQQPARIFRFKVFERGSGAAVVQQQPAAAGQEQQEPEPNPVLDAPATGDTPF